MFSTCLGGSGKQEAQALALNLAGAVSAYVVGITNSPDFPVTQGAFQTVLQGDSSVFVSRIDVAGLGPVITAVKNGASFVDGPQAPGAAISIGGTNLATAAGATVLVNGKPIPVSYTSPTQINAQLPFELQAGSATLIVTSAGVSSPRSRSPSAPLRPAFFWKGTTPRPRTPLTSL